MIGFLLALHPKEWREQYGDEFAALIEDTQLGPAAVLDVVNHAAKLHARAHAGLPRVSAAIAASAFFEVVSLRTGLTANILWSPSDPWRALALIATIGPWLVLIGPALARRYQRRGEANQNGSERC